MHRHSLNCSKTFMENKRQVQTELCLYLWLFKFSTFVAAYCDCKANKVWHPYLNEAVWFAHCRWCLQAGSPWTKWSLGQGSHWQHRAWWLFLFAQPLSAEGPCLWWGSHEESGFLQKNKKKTVKLGAKKGIIHKIRIMILNNSMIATNQGLEMWARCNCPAKANPGQVSLVHWINSLQLSSIQKD